MEVVSNAQQTTTVSTASRTPRHRRSRRGRGNNVSTSLDFRPASIAPQAITSSVSDAPDQQSGSDVHADATSSHGRGRGRGRGRGGASHQARTVNGRQFGGQLTRQETNQSTSSQGCSAAAKPEQNLALSGDAAAFVPGQPSVINGISSHSRAPAHSHHQKRRFSKSQAPDIATRTHEDIDNRQYECAICVNEVRRNSKVWSCHTCWSVFHLTCIKKWAANEESKQQQQQSTDPTVVQPRQWRCPGCNLPKSEVPRTYSCWCEKEVEPRPLAGIPPHSCGNTCGKERARLCPHPCNLTCHAGPCPPCQSMGPTQICFCGKHEVTHRCSDTNYDSGWSCGDICGEVMPCGEHTCPAPCHEGLCGGCATPVFARCYCGQIEKEVLCEERGDQKECQRPIAVSQSEDQRDLLIGGEEEVDIWTGSFDCGNVCQRTFDCGMHQCERPCHAQDLTVAHCPRSIDVVTHCPCGKTSIDELLDLPRAMCTDAIPRCQKRCAKVLDCGHEDEAECHAGPCMPCTKIVDVKCRCGRTTSQASCHRMQADPPECTRSCKTLLNCGRHNCAEICCPGERQAAERQSIKRKQRPLGSIGRHADEGFEAEHICTLQCGRELKCGTHYCQELCHKGPCGTCREATFDEISCHCGRTVLQPPLPCGTRPPICQYTCTRPRLCGHPRDGHSCHNDDVACSKCQYLVEKPCMCGKKRLKNQRCYIQDVGCGLTCGKTLKCGSHSCTKTCHRPGDCEDSDGQACRQPCGKPKKICGHPDVENVCHAPFACKEDKPCQSKTFVTCECQAQKQELRCGASKTNLEGNTQKTLPCNEECARLERNRKLAVALNIDQTTHVEAPDHVPYSDETLKLFAARVQWAQDQEREFRVFANSDEERRLRFKPMRAQQRAFIHALAEDFGLDSESMDPEPHRHVSLWKTPRFVSAPHKTLADSLRIKQAQRAIIASANVSDAEDQSQKQASAAAAREPFNGFLITKPRFGLTIDELRAEISKSTDTETPLTIDIEFLPSDEIVLRAISRTLDSADLQKALLGMRERVVTAINGKGYGICELCTIDSSLHVLRRESDAEKSQGWSKVAGKKTAPKFAVPASGFAGTNAFSVLGSNKVTFVKKKTEKVKATKPVVVEDWEAAELAEEEKEKPVGVEEETTAASSGATEVGLVQSAERSPIESLAMADSAASPPLQIEEETEESGGSDTKAVTEIEQGM